MEEKKRKIGIIVGRFQVPTITEGHRYFIKTVTERSDKTIIFVGTTKTGLLGKRNPLPFEAVKASLMEETRGYDVEIFSIKDIGNLPFWVQQLDLQIDSLFTLNILNRDTDEITLYGSRDSMVSGYRSCNGKYNTSEIISSVPDISGTAERERIGKTYTPNFDKRDRYLLVWYSQRYLPSENPEKP